MSPFSTATSDQEWMRRALQLARRGEGSVEPNPMVGCVIVRDGIVIAEGYHRQFGQAHAEVEALRALTDLSHAKGATAYVTLEPCCHTGKTPPCTEALIGAKVSRVVVAMRDPFPKVDGGGIKRLQDAGIEVQVGVEQMRAEELNAPYLKRLRHGRPWVIAKWAMSIDGRIATSTGDSQWISNEISRGEVHRLRGRMDAIIVGSGTVAADNPTLTARPAGPRTASRIVFAGRRVPTVTSNLARTIPDAPLLIVAGHHSDHASLRALELLGAEILVLKATESAAQVAAVLEELGRRQFTNVLVEGGRELLGSFADADEIDEIQAYVCPQLIGGKAAPGPVGGVGIERIAHSRRFECVDTTRFDGDLRVTLRRRRS